MRFGVIDGDSLPQFVAGADEKAKLKLVIEFLARSEVGLVGVAFCLAYRTADRRSADDDRRTTAVISDGHPFVIRHQRIVGPEQFADSRGVMHADVKIRVIADMRGQGIFRAALCHETLPQAGLQS